MIESDRQPPPRRGCSGCFLTLLWLLPLMAVLAGVGFFLGRDVFSPRFLRPSHVQRDKPRAVRILPAGEMTRRSKDQPSRIWTEGVKDSDIPKLTPERAERAAKPRRTKPAADFPGAEPKTDPSHEQPIETQEPLGNDAGTPDGSNDAPDAPAGTD